MHHHLRGSTAERWLSPGYRPKLFVGMMVAIWEYLRRPVQRHHSAIHNSGAGIPDRRLHLMLDRS